MNALYSIPPKTTMELIEAKTPSYMGKNMMPHAIVAEGALHPEICEHIVDEMTCLEPYSFHGCNAITRESPRDPLPSCLDPIFAHMVEINSSVFRFDLRGLPGAWFQEYRTGNSYQLHRDGEIGQSRKLTTVALLSPESAYEGGSLKIVPFPKWERIPRTQGTMVTFPSWLLHEVEPVESGVRYTINMGAWGPPFR